MKRIIKGVAYNTETSTRVARSRVQREGPTLVDNDDMLYLTRRGAFFVHERDNVTDEDRLRPLSRDETLDWFSEAEIEPFHEFQYELPQATAESSELEATIYVRVPEPLKRQIEAMAKDAGQSVNAWTMRCIEKCVQTQKQDR